MSSVGDLVAYLTVNHAGFKQGFAQAQAVAARGSAAITASIAPISAALAPLTAALGAAFGAGSAIAAAKEDARAMTKLQSVLKATGGAAGLSADEIGAYASELQRATNFGDEVTVGGAAMLATFRNVKGDAFKEALKLAQDWTALTGGDMASSAQAFGKALNDPIAGITRLSKLGIQFTDQQKQQIKTMQEAGDVSGAQGVILDQMAATFGGTASNLADPWTQLKNLIGDIGEQVGGLLIPHVNNFSEALMGVATQGVDTFASLKDMNQSFADNVAISYATLGDQAYLWYLKAELAVVQTASAFGHFFTQELPVWLQWIGDNWQDVFFTMGDYAFTILSNLGENIRTVWQAVLDFIAGNPINLNFKGLTEGAVNAIKEMPDIPARVASEFEKSLQDDIKAQEDFLRKSQEQVADNIIQKREDNRKALEFVPKSGDEASKKQGKDLKVGALQQGSAEALSAVFKAMRGTHANSIEEKMLHEDEEQTELLSDMRDALNDMARTPGVQLVAGSLV